MSGIDKLAQRLAELHKQNRNSPSSAPRTCTVVGTSPLKIQWGDSIIITEEKLYIPKIYSEGFLIPNRFQNLSGEMIEDTILWKIDLAIGDNVIIMPDENFKMWYLIDLI